MAEGIYSPDSPEEYYASLQGTQGSLESKFNSIDDKTNFEDYMQRLKNPLTRSFVLDFGNDHAYCATDLDTTDLRGLLSRPVS
jgi:hypothetical protein